MVILDTFGTKDMLTASPTATNPAAASSGASGQYINPDDILNPLSLSASGTEMDSKASPLAMLAKTCSQIGADPIMSTKSRKGPTPDLRTSPSSNLLDLKKQPRSRSSSTEIKVTDTLLISKKSSPKINEEKSTPTPTLRSGLEVMTSNLRPLPPSYPNLLNNPFLANLASNESSSGVCRDPLCRDPLCPTALRNQQQLNFTYSSLLASSPYYKEAMMAFSLAQQRMASVVAASPLSHVCNWVAGTEYCGRRFANSEELLVHVKTHTNLSTSDPRALSILNSSTPPAAAAASTTTTTSSTRFHPYARPPSSTSLPPIPAAPFHPPPPPPSALAASLASNPYASLYSSLFAPPRPPLL